MRSMSSGDHLLSYTKCSFRMWSGATSVKMASAIRRFHNMKTCAPRSALYAVINSVRSNSETGTLSSSRWGFNSIWHVRNSAGRSSSLAWFWKQEMIRRLTWLTWRCSRNGRPNLIPNNRHLHLATNPSPSLRPTCENQVRNSTQLNWNKWHQLLNRRH